MENTGGASRPDGATVAFMDMENTFVTDPPAPTCPDCGHPWAEHLHGVNASGTGCYVRLDRQVVGPDAGMPKWCPCANPPPAP